MYAPTHLPGCTPCPRKVKCPSTHRIEGFSGQHRLEVRPSSDEDRPLRLQTDTATQTGHQLETGSRDSPEGTRPDETNVLLSSPAIPLITRAAVVRWNILIKEEAIDREFFKAYNSLEGV